MEFFLFNTEQLEILLSVSDLEQEMRIYLRAFIYLFIYFFSNTLKSLEIFIHISSNEL